MNLDRAPIIIFAFNRPVSLKTLICSLLTNPEIVESHLYIFIDGPRSEEEKCAVNEVYNFVSSITGFKSITISLSNKNKGLGPSVIEGVTKVINKHGKAIILEDDLILQPNFLKFMNDGLARFENVKDVFSICGYSNKIKIPADYEYDSYFCTRSSSWGWGTWRDRWDSVKWNFENLNEYDHLKKQFNHWGGSDCFGMLQDCIRGKNKSWAIRFCFAQFLQEKVSLFPTKSLVINDGFDGNGSNCKKWSRFKYELMSQEKIVFRFPKDIKIDKQIYLSAMRYHSFLSRVKSRFMYIITTLK